MHTDPVAFSLYPNLQEPCLWRGSCKAEELIYGGRERSVFYSANRIDKSTAFTSLVSVPSEM